MAFKICENIDYQGFSSHNLNRKKADAKFLVVRIQNSNARILLKIEFGIRTIDTLKAIIQQLQFRQRHRTKSLCCLQSMPSIGSFLVLMLFYFIAILLQFLVRKQYLIMIEYFTKLYLKRTKSIDFVMPKLSDNQKSSCIWNKLQIKFKLALFNHNSNPIFFHHPLTNVVNLKGKKSYKKNCKVLYKFYIGILPNAPLTIMICVT